jgi:hypothetical protein
MLTRIVLLIALLTPLRAIVGDDDGYILTVAKARAMVRELSTDCEKATYKPRLPYRETFEKAMRGDVKALYTVFTDENYHSGDNEGWISTAWPLMYVVGDKRFAAFLQTLDERTQRDIFDTVLCCYPPRLKKGYFERKFPRVAAIYKRLHPPNASN